jgi:transposase
MLIWEDWMEIKDLHRQGHSIRQICRLTGYSRNTVRKVVRESVLKPKARKPRASMLDEFKPYLHKRFVETGLSAVRLLEEIRQMGFQGSVDIVRRYLNEIEEPRRALARATVRFETPPGEQAQVDWAEAGSFIDEAGRRKKVYAFVMILGFSRMLYVEFVLSMKLDILIGCHQNAFAYFGGFPRSILYDNMAQVRLPSGGLNRQMLDFLDHHGIVLKTHRPYRPRTKGKVERSVGYLKDNFLKGREFADLADLQTQGFHWQEEIANRRMHATTKARPIDLFAQEKPILIPLSSIPKYRLSLRRERTVSSEGFVSIGGSRYSVPPTTVGQKVIVELGEQRVFVRLGEVIIAEHRRAQTVGECIANPGHVAEMWKLSLTRRNVPPPAERLLFQSVQATPLRVYEEAAN